MPVLPLKRTLAIRATLLFAVIGVSGAYPVFAADAPATPVVMAQATAEPPTTPAQKSLLLDMQDAFTRIALTAEPFVVNIKSARTMDLTTRLPKDLPLTPPGTGNPNGNGGTDPSPFPRRSESTGSGAIVTADGYIITNDHVVEGSKFVTVTLNDGREFTGTVASDHSSDLAIVKIDAGGVKLPYCAFADSDTVAAGQWAIAIGSPFGLENTMTVGVISALHRHQTIGDSPANARYYPDLIQTDAAINPGNSGGPLINMDGQVVGINVAIESPVEGSAGVGFAIPARIAKIIMNELITKGKVTRGYLGLAPTDLTPAKRTAYGVASGAWVLQVDKDSPAGRAGIHAADTIQGFDDKSIDSELSLRIAIAESTPGKTVPVKIIRDGQPVNVNVTIAAPPAPPSTTSNTNQAPPVPPKKIGVSVRTLAATDRDQLGLDPSATGAFVTAVLSNSPAERAGLTTGDVITKIGKAPITNSDDAAAALTALPPGAQTVVVITRSTGADKQQEIALDLKFWR